MLNIKYSHTVCILSPDTCLSERADPSYCKDRITEGANINKSLVTLGIVISTLGMCNKMNIFFILKDSYAQSHETPYCVLYLKSVLDLEY